MKKLSIVMVRSVLKIRLNNIITKAFVKLSMNCLAKTQFERLFCYLFLIIIRVTFASENNRDFFVFTIHTP